MQAGDADLVHKFRQLLREGGRDAVALAGWWLVEETGPDAGQAGAVLQLVPAVDALALELVQAALEGLRRQEDDRLDARERVFDVELSAAFSSWDLSSFAFWSVKCSGFSIVLVLPPSRNSQVEPLLVAVPGWDLISTRKRPPGVAMNRSTSRTCPLAAVNVKVCQAR